MNKLTKWLLAGLLLAVGFFVYRNRKQSTISQTLPDAPPPPLTVNTLPNQVGSPVTGNGGAVIPLSPTSTVVQEEVKARVRLIYENEQAREDAYYNFGVRNDLFIGMQYSSGTKMAMAQVTSSGVPEDLKIPPEDVERNFKSKLDLLKETTDFETLDHTIGFEQALNTWKEAADLSSVGGNNLWPGNIRDLIEQSAFGTPGGADQNRSERYRAFGYELQKLAENLDAASSKAQSALEDRAYRDLVAAGWVITGYS